MCVCFALCHRNVGVVYVRYGIHVCLFVVWVSDLKSIEIFPIKCEG